VSESGKEAKAEKAYWKRTGFWARQTSIVQKERMLA